MSKKILISVFLVIIFFSQSAFRAVAQEETSQLDSPWEINPYIDVGGGLGLVVDYGGYSLIPEQTTKLYISLCGNYNSGGFFRNPDGTEFSPSTGNDYNRGFYKKSNYGLGAGITQDLFPNEDKGMLQAFLFYKYRNDQYLRAESPNSLIFHSGLPDQDGIKQTTFLTGLLYGNMNKNSAYLTQQGVYSTISWEAAPKNVNDCADFSRFNFMISGFTTLFDNEDISIDMGDRIIYDLLSGDYIPINARTSFGGFNPLAGVEMPGLGGGVRGIPIGRFDSETKYLNNLEMRLHFPSLINEKLVPEAIVFTDCGKRDESPTIYSSIGAGLGIHNKYLLEFDVIFYYNHFINENYDSFFLVIGSTHF